MNKAALVVLCFSLSGCSLFMRTPPSDYAGDSVPKCDDSYLIPAADLVGGTFLVLMGSLGVATGNSPDSPNNVTTGLVIVGLGVPFIPSGVLGVSRASNCKSAQALFAAKREAAESAVAESKRDAEAERMRALEERKAANPLVNLPVVITNGHAEALIKVVIRMPETAEEFDLGWTRLGLGETGRPTTRASGRGNHRLHVDVRATFLGEEHDAGVSVTPFKPGHQLHVFFDWDTALAKYRSRIEWEPIDAPVTGG